MPDWPPFSQKAIDAIKDPNTIAIPNGKEWIYTSDVDWIGLMMDHSFQQTHNLTISKASDRSSILFPSAGLIRMECFLNMVLTIMTVLISAQISVLN